MMHAAQTTRRARKSPTAMKSLMLVAQQRQTEVYFGDPAIVVIQVTKPILVQTDSETVRVRPGREWRGYCRWLRFSDGRGAAVILRHSAPNAFVEEL